MNKKIIPLICISVLLIGTAQASLIGIITTQGLNFVNPQLAQAVSTVMCVTSPGGLITCAKNFVEGKIIGKVTGEVLQQIAEVSPEAAKAIIQYNTIKGYIDQGAEIIKEIRIDENGVYDGIIGFKEGDNSVMESFPDSNLEDIIISNSKLDLKTKSITLKEGGYLKLKIKDEQGNVQELEYKNIAEGGIIQLNEDGTIKSAEFKTSDSATYIFGNHPPLSVSANILVKYYPENRGDEIVKVIEVTPDRVGSTPFYYGDYEVFSHGKVYFSENSLDCKLCNIKNKNYIGSIDLINSFASFTKEGIVLNYGSVEYDGFAFSPLRKEGILIAKKDINLDNYDKNWIQRNEHSLEMKSSKQGEFKLKSNSASDGNKLLKTNLNSELEIELSLGDGMRFEERENQNIIPKTILKPSSPESNLKLKNDGLTFSVSDGNVYLKEDSNDALSKFNKGIPYQSVAMEIESSNTDSGKIRVNSYRQFASLSEKYDQVLTYNSYGLPISSKIEDNYLTFDKLKEKYSNLNFIEKDEWIPAAAMPPFQFYLLDSFLKEHPESAEDFTSISFYEDNNAYVDIFGGLHIGLITDPSSGSFSTQRIREISSPLQILTHELEHRKDQILYEEELDLLVKQNPSYIELSTTIKKYKEIKEKMKANKDKLSRSDIDEFTRRKMNLDELIYSKKYPMLSQKTNKLITSHFNDYLQNKQAIKQLYNIPIQINQEYIIPNLNEIISKKGFNLDSLYEEYKDKAYHHNLEGNEKIIKTFADRFNHSKERVQKELKIKEKELQDIIYTKNKNFKENPVLINLLMVQLTQDKKFENDRDKLIKMIRINEFGYGSIRQTGGTDWKNDFPTDIWIEDLFKLKKYPELRKYSYELEQNLRQYSGIQYLYNLKNYAQFSTNIEGGGSPSDDFSEVYTTLIERPTSDISNWLNYGSPQTQEFLRIIVQSEFDSGKADLAWYKQIMGEDFCKDANCLDKICSEYKLLCCEEHPNSPNC